MHEPLQLMQLMSLCCASNDDTIITIKSIIIITTVKIIEKKIEIRIIIRITIIMMTQKGCKHVKARPCRCF